MNEPRALRRLGIGVAGEERWLAESRRARPLSGLRSCERGATREVTALGRAEATSGRDRQGSRAANASGENGERESRGAGGSGCSVADNRGERESRV